MKFQANTVLDKISEISAHINIKGLEAMVETTRNGLKNSDRLRLSIVGQSFSQLPEILSGILEKPDLFTKPFGRTAGSFVLKAIYSETEQYKIFSNGSDIFSVTRDVFEKHFCRQSHDSNALYGEIHINAPLLRVMDITLICSASEYEEYDWIAKFSQSDFLVLVLNAEVLLSMLEKNFIRDVIGKSFGFERCAFLLNNYDRIEESDRGDVIEYMRHFLSTSGIKAPFYEYSALSVLDSQAHERSVNQEYSKFIQMVGNELIEKSVSLHEASLTQSVNLCLEALCEFLLQFREGLKLDKNNIEEAVASLKKRDEHFQKSIESIGRKVQLFINGFVKIEFINKIEEFSKILKHDIQEDIMDCNDIAEVKKNIPSYLEYIWEQFFENQGTWLKKMVFAEMLDIHKIIETDIREYVKGMNADVSELINSHLDNKLNFRVLISKKREKDSISSLTSYMNLGAMGLLLISFPWAVITFGTAQILRFAFKKSIKNSEKEALVTAVFEGCDKLTAQILSQVENQFNDMTCDLKEHISNTYNDILDLIAVSLEQQANNIANGEELLKYLDNVESVVIPELKSAVSL